MYTYTCITSMHTFRIFRYFNSLISICIYMCVIYVCTCASITVRSDYVTPSFKSLPYFLLALLGTVSTPSCLPTLQSQAPVQSDRFPSLTHRLLLWEPFINPVLHLALSHLLAFVQAVYADYKLPHSLPIRCLPRRLLFIHLEWVTVPSELSPLKSQCLAQCNPQWMNFWGCPTMESRVASYLPPDHSAHCPLCESISQVCAVPGSTCLFDYNHRAGPVPLLSIFWVHSQCPAQALAHGCYPVYACWMNELMNVYLL